MLSTVVRSPYSLRPMLPPTQENRTFASATAAIYRESTPKPLAATSRRSSFGVGGPKKRAGIRYVRTSGDSVRKKKKKKLPVSRATRRDACGHVMAWHVKALLLLLCCSVRHKRREHSPHGVRNWCCAYTCTSYIISRVRTQPFLARTHVIIIMYTTAVYYTWYLVYTYLCITRVPKYNDHLCTNYPITTDIMPRDGVVISKDPKRVVRDVFYQQ